jgi:5-methylthioadenosine/S-adenosylhomocysteine deaminase
MRANLVWAVFEHEGLEKLERTSAFIEKWQGAADMRIATWMGPHSPYTCSPDFLRLCARRASELEVGVHIHVSETDQQVKLSFQQYGLTPVQVLAETGILDRPCILAHCVAPWAEDFSLLKGSKCGIAHAPKTYLKLGGPTAPVAKFLAEGIPVGLATDGAASSNTLDILEQMRLMALTQKGLAGNPEVLPVGEVLSVAFKGSAKVFNSPDLGELTPGKLADLVLMKMDGSSVFPAHNMPANLVYSAHTHDIDTVICNGKVLLRGGKLQTIDKELVKREVAQRLERLSRIVPWARIASYPV